MEATAANLLAAYLHEHGFIIKQGTFHSQVHTGIFWISLLPQDNPAEILIQIDGRGGESFDVHDPKSFPEVIAYIVKQNAMVLSLRNLCTQLEQNGLKCDLSEFHARIHNGSFWMPIELTDKVGLFRVGGISVAIRNPIIGGSQTTFEGLLKYLKECDHEAKCFVANINERARKGIDG